MTAKRFTIGLFILGLAYTLFVYLAPRHGLELNAIHQKGWVIQRGQSILIRGEAGPGRTVKISLGPIERELTVPRNQKWKILLPPLNEHPSPLCLNVSSYFRQKRECTTEVKPVYLGDVWFCSGQSNAVCSLERLAQTHYNNADPLQVDARKKLKEALSWKNDELHFFIPHKAQGQAQKTFEELPGQWISLNSDAIKKAPALAVFFGESLKKRHKGHLGIICNGVDGAKLESLCPEKLLDQSPPAQQRLAHLKNEDKPSVYDWTTFIIKRSRWELKNHFNLSLGPRPGRPRGPLERFDTPSSLYRGMIEPCDQIGASGLLWYQGESNTKAGYHPAHYQGLLRDFLQHWQRRSTNPHFKALVLPLTGFGPMDQPALATNPWCNIRQATLLSSHAPFITAIPSHDCGQINNIHPINKFDLGQRAADVVIQEHTEFVNPSFTVKRSGSFCFLSTPQALKLLKEEKTKLGPQLGLHHGPIKGLSLELQDGSVERTTGSLLENGQLRIKVKAYSKCIRYAFETNPRHANLIGNRGFPIHPFIVNVEEPLVQKRSGANALKP